MSLGQSGGAPARPGFTDDARGIRPWLGGVALGTAGFAATTEYVVSEHFPILEPTFTLVPVIVASALAAIAIVWHLAFFARVTPRLDHLSDPTVWGLLVTAPGTFAVGAIAVATRSTSEQVTTLAVGVGLAGILCAGCIAVGMVWSILISPAEASAKVTGACFVPGTILMLAPILTSRESAKDLALNQQLLVTLPIACFVAGFGVFLLILSLFAMNLIRHGLPPKQARPGLVILTSPLSVSGVAIVSLTVIDGEPLGDARYVAAHVASAALLILATGWFLACYLPVVRVVFRAAEYTPLWWSFVFPLAAFATAWLVAGRNSGVGLITGVGFVLWVALLVLMLWVALLTVITGRRTVGEAESIAQTLEGSN